LSPNRSFSTLKQGGCPIFWLWDCFQCCVSHRCRLCWPSDMPPACMHASLLGLRVPPQARVPTSPPNHACMKKSLIPKNVGPDDWISADGHRRAFSLTSNCNRARAPRFFLHAVVAINDAATRHVPLQGTLWKVVCSVGGSVQSSSVVQSRSSNLFQHLKCQASQCDGTRVASPKNWHLSSPAVGAALFD
jgi:hypothetical protein